MKDFSVSYLRRVGISADRLNYGKRGMFKATEKGKLIREDNAKMCKELFVILKFLPSLINTMNFDT